jgi:MFS family permease
MTFVLGQVMDYFEALDNLEGGFIFAAISILIFCVADFVCLMLIKNDIKSRQEVKKAEPLRKVMKKLGSNKGFWNILILQVLWNVAMYTTVGFLGTYRINEHELGFTVGQVAIINIVGNLGRFAFSRPFGLYADKHSYAKALRLALIIAAASFAAGVFTTPATRYLIIAHTFLYCTCFAGMSVNMLNICYSYVPKEYFVQASAIKNCVGGICGFVVSILAGMLLEHIQSNGNTFLGIPVYGQQVLSLISFVLLIGAVLFTKFVMEKEKSMIQ